MTARRARWRVMQVGKPDRVGEWQEDYRAAQQDAIRCGVASGDERAGYFLDVLTKIEEEPDRTE